MIAGVDEVGRGCLAGPVVAGAVVFTRNHRPIPGVMDSKLLSESQRENLYNLITQSAYAWGVAEVSVKEINDRGIVPATMKAMQWAVRQLGEVNRVMIDGKQSPELEAPVVTLVHGDRLCYSIAAASILAKVWRDKLMRQLALGYPKYDWLHNKGYGTKKHRVAILNYGLTIHHRSLFVRKVLGYA